MPRGPEQRPAPRRGQEGRRLVAAEVQRSHGRDRGRRAGEERRQRCGVRGLVGPGVGVEERELGADQADALGARLERGLDLGRAAGVREQAHAAAVDRGGRRRRSARSRAACSRAAATRCSSRARISVRDRRRTSPRSASTPSGSPSGISRSSAPRRGHERDAQRASHDRRMGRGAAPGEHDGRHAPRPGRDLAWSELLGEQDRPRAGARPAPAAASSPARRAMARRSAARAASVGSARLRERPRAARQPRRWRPRRRRPPAPPRPPPRRGSASAAISSLAATISASARVAAGAQRCRQRRELAPGSELEAAPCRTLLLGTCAAARHRPRAVAGPGGAQRGARRRRAGRAALSRSWRLMPRTRAARARRRSARPRWRQGPGGRSTARRDMTRGPCGPASARWRACPPRPPRALAPAPRRAAAGRDGRAQRLDGRAPARRPSSCRRARRRRARRSRPGRRRARRTSSAGRDLRRRRRAPCRRAAGRCPTAGRWRRRPCETSVEPAATSTLPGGSGAVEPASRCLDGAEPALHVRAVVGVADGGIELRQVVALLADARRRTRASSGRTVLGVHAVTASGLTRPSAARPS